jgi:hypothetical protein
MHSIRAKTVNADGRRPSTRFGGRHPGRGQTNWKPLGKSLIGTAFGADRAGHWVTWIAQSPSNANVGYAATAAGRLFRTENLQASAAQVTWRRVDSVRTPTRFPTGIVVDPANPDVNYVSYSEYAAYTPEPRPTYCG